MNSVVSIRELRYCYPGGPPVLDIEQLEVRAGDHVFLHGPSGCGKSTLLGVIAGVLTAGKGTVQVLGQDLAKLNGPSRDRLRGAGMGYIFQMFNLIPYLTARDNIAMPLQLHAERRHRAGAGIGEAVRQLAARLEIESLLDRKAVDLSVGQQQRVAAARALIGAPPLLIADEPTSALDAAHRDEFLSLLFEQAAATSVTLLFVSHDLSLAGRFTRSIRLPEINRAASAGLE